MSSVIFETKDSPMFMLAADRDYSEFSQDNVSMRTKIQAQTTMIPEPDLGTKLLQQERKTWLF